MTQEPIAPTLLAELGRGGTIVLSERTVLSPWDQHSTTTMNHLRDQCRWKLWQRISAIVSDGLAVTVEVMWREEPDGNMEARAYLKLADAPLIRQRAQP